MSGPFLWLSETRVKNEEGNRDDSVPKTSNTRRPCKVGLRVCNNILQPPLYISVFWGLRKIVAYSQSYLAGPSCFGTVSSLYPSSFLMIFTLVYKGAITPF